MTRREELEEAYEDAYFELLMDEVAEMEGAYWEEVRKELENDPAAAMPESVERRCVQTIKRCFARQRRQKNLRIAKRVLNRAAVFVAMASVLFTTVLALSEDARVVTANLLITINERYSELHMDTSETAYESEGALVLEDDYFSKIHIGWLPEGFFVSGKSPDKMLDLKNAEGFTIAIDCYSGSSTIQVDTEDADSIDYIEINGHETIKIIKDGDTHLVLINKDRELFVDVLVSKGVSPDVAIKIMQNISFI